MGYAERANGNHAARIAVIGGATVPIVGQPGKVVGFAPVLTVQCGCDEKTALQLVGLTPGGCPACRTVFQLKTVRYDADTKQLEVELNQTRMPDPPAK